MCKDCGTRRYWKEKDRGQGVVKEKKWEELKRYGECLKKEKGKVALMEIKRFNHETKVKARSER